MTIEVPCGRAFFNELAIPAFDELSMLYFHREHKLSRRLGTVSDVRDVDLRIKYNIKHLKLFPEACYALSSERYDLLDEGDAFASASMAFLLNNLPWLKEIFTVYAADDRCAAALAFAMTWLPKPLCLDWLKRLSVSHDPNHKYVAVLACDFMEIYPKNMISGLLQREDCQKNLGLYKQLLTLVGHARDRTLIPSLVNASQHDDASVQLAALRARLLCGDTDCIHDAAMLSLDSSDAFNSIYSVLIRRLSKDASDTYMKHVIESPHIAIDLKIMAIGVHGDPGAVPWLISQMHNQHLSRFCGVAFLNITGIDSTAAGLQSPSVDDDDEEEETGNFLNEDDSCPLLDQSKLSEFWHANAESYARRQRHVFGQPADAEINKHLLFLEKSNVIFEYQTAKIELAILDGARAMPTSLLPLVDL